MELIDQFTDIRVAGLCKDQPRFHGELKSFDRSFSQRMFLVLSDYQFKNLIKRINIVHGDGQLHFKLGHDGFSSPCFLYTSSSLSVWLGLPKTHTYPTRRRWAYISPLTT